MGREEKIIFYVEKKEIEQRHGKVESDSGKSG